VHTCVLLIGIYVHHIISLYTILIINKLYEKAEYKTVFIFYYCRKPKYLKISSYRTIEVKLEGYYLFQIYFVGTC